MRLWIFIFAFALATGIGIIISHDPGYALFAYDHWSIEMPLWLCAAVLIVLIVGSVLALSTLKSLFSTSHTLKNWWKNQKIHTAQLQTYKGLLELAEGRFEKAERYLSQGASLSQTPLINYLSAARAAGEAGATERRDHYLQLALESDQSSKVAVRLTQAQLQFQQGDKDRSIQTLEALQKEFPKHKEVLRLLSTVYEANHNLEGLLSLLPLLKKTKALSETALETLTQKVYPALLPRAAEQGLEALHQFWKKSPAALQENARYIAQYAKFLKQYSARKEAETLLRTAIKRNWDRELMYLYGFIRTDLLDKQLAFAEAFLKTHPEEPYLLLTLGRLCLANALWGKARAYLEKSAALCALPETYSELGQLMEHLGLPDQKEAYYKKGLLLATPSPLSASNEPLCLSFEERNL